ncbi:putative cytochrome P450 [Hyaloscypha variabilis F]|uniref:Putative cytochrome P450 n=1 Tax=Hyaloscypha variabilis (strain UAMH 11265 / GT02V1 / F) TaxID=1149755 RepID=A0A2J6R8Z0_HYAVF|nr:putative cytochrome P450 [Hyaloscypha variabilis F]
MADVLPPVTRKPNDFDPLESNDPSHIYAEYDKLRTTCPVAFTDRYNGFWLLSRYEDVKSVALDGTIFISSVKAVVPSDPRGIRRPPLNFDAPAHTPYRTALDRTLKPTRLKRLEKVLEAHAEKELAPMLEAGGGDICMEYGARFPAWVETEWLNLDSSYTEGLAASVAGWIKAWRAPDGDATTAFSTKLYKTAETLLENRRQNPGCPEDDPASSLLLEKDSEGNFLENSQLIACLRQSLVVGMVAPPLLIGAICNHLSKDQELQTQLRSDLALIPAATEEFIRLYTPYRGFSRTASKSVSLHGRDINPGEPITLSYSAANRDPSIFPDPDKFVLNRENLTSHLGFGRGRHRCAGMPLARMMIQIALRVLLKKTKRFEVKGPLEYARMPEMGIISCLLSISI